MKKKLLNFALRYFPNLTIRFISIPHSKEIDLAYALFGKKPNNKRIDFKPFREGRGFYLVLDNSFSIWFNQDGDHFVYDGWEMGEYSKGDVTIFDKLK